MRNRTFSPFTNTGHAAILCAVLLVAAWFSSKWLADLCKGL